MQKQWNGTKISTLDFQNKTVLVVGDIMLDEYVVGDNYRISDEAPVPILGVDTFEVRLGGAANVAHNLMSLGCQTLLCGTIGRGEGHLRHGHSARRLMTLIDQLSIPSDLIISSERCITTTKTRIVINGQQVARYDYENIVLSADIQSEILHRLRKVKYTSVDLIIVSDYNKGVISAEVMSFLKSTDIPTVVDPKPEHCHLYSDIFCITPNIAEFARMADVQIVCKDNMVEVAQQFIDKHRLHCVVITMGMQGSFYCDSKQHYFGPGVKKEVIDIIGAGDTFVSIWGLAIIDGMSPVDALSLANTGAGLVVSQKYTSVCSLKELETEHYGS